MIRIRREECPRFLKRRKLGKKAYKNDQVVDVLFKMQHGKCCYCEVKIGCRGHEKTVEHFRPKEERYFPELKNEWENLLLACSICNGTKENHFPTTGNGPRDGNPLLIDPADPDDVDPEDHITFNVAFEDHDGLLGVAVEVNNSARGIAMMDYSGIRLSVKKNARRCHLFRRLFRDWMDVTEAGDQKDEVAKQAVLERIRSSMRSNAPFAGLARAFYASVQLTKRYGLQIPTGADA